MMQFAKAFEFSAVMVFFPPRFQVEAKRKKTKKHKKLILPITSWEMI